MIYFCLIILNKNKNKNRKKKNSNNKKNGLVKYFEKL